MMYIYGAGYNGRIVARLLKNIGYQNSVEGFIDNNDVLQGKSVEGLSVFPASRLDSDSRAIVSAGEKFTEEIVESLTNHNVRNFIFYNEIRDRLFCNDDQAYWNDYDSVRNISICNEMLRNITEKCGRYCVESLVICVGQACSLKCKECGNLAPYAPIESMHYNVDEIINDLDCFLKAIDYLCVLQIQGGGGIHIQRFRYIT